MQTLSPDPVLPDTAQLREKLAEIIARVGQCEPEPLLEDQDFSAVVAQFDSLAVLEILLEVETEYGIETDEMLPVDQDKGAEELLSVFPKNLSELVVYMHEVVARRPQREAELQARTQKLRELTNPAVAEVEMAGEASTAPDAVPPAASAKPSVERSKP